MFRVVYHAKPSNKRTKKNAKLLALLGKAALRPRFTSKICHDKYIVLSKLEGNKRTPVSVLCGSTNFVVQIVEDENTADRRSGSHNFSQPASGGNDENYMIIRGNRDVADYSAASFSASTTTIDFASLPSNNTSPKKPRRKDRV